MHRACLKSPVVAQGLLRKENGLCYSEVLQDKGCNGTRWKEGAKDSEVWLNYGMRVANSVSNCEAGMV